MKRKIWMVLLWAFLLTTVSACNNNKTVYLETSADEEAGETEQEQTEEDERKGSTEEETQQTLCYVYICGAVAKPGVYAVPSHARVYEVISLAGGLLAEAGEQAVNQAREVVDGEMIRVPTKEELIAGEAEQSFGDEGTEAQDGLIDINRADAAELMTLPGIGASKADSIISYREENGGFSSIEDIMNVEGIKEGVFNRIKEHIKVK